MTKGVKKGQKKKSTSNAVKAIVKMVRNQPKRKAGRAGKQGSRQGGVPRASRASVGALGLGGGQSGSTNRRQQVIEEDEYVGEVLGSVGFATTQYSINPGQAGTFPWASRIFALYEEYDFTFLEFYYKREVSEYATNGQTGKVMLSLDYDASDAAPTTKQQVEDTQAHVDFMPNTPFASLRADVALMRRNPGKYVRLGAQPANTDIKTYDAGNLFVSTFGCANTTAVGELHVRYRCVAREPVLEAASIAGGVVHFSGIAPTTANNFATAVLQPGGTVALQGITALANVITFPAGIPGNYLVSMTIAGSTSATGLTLSAGTATALNLFSQAGVRDATFAQYPAGANAPYADTALGTFTVATGGGTVAVSPATLVGGNAMDLFITSLPVSVLTVAQSETANLAKMAARVNRLERLLDLIDAADDEDVEEEKYFVPRDIEECHLGVSCSAPPSLRRQDTSAERSLAGAIRGAIVRRSNLPLVVEAELPPAKKA
jgi:hypothetical protein